MSTIIVSGSQPLCCLLIFSHLCAAKVSSSLHSPFKLTLFLVSIFAQVHYTKYCTHYYPLNNFTQSVLVSKVRAQ